MCIAATSELPGEGDLSDLGDSNCGLGDDDVYGENNGDGDQHGRHRSPTIRGGVEVHCEHLWLVPGGSLLVSCVGNQNIRMGTTWFISGHQCKFNHINDNDNTNGNDQQDTNDDDNADNET